MKRVFMAKRQLTGTAVSLPWVLVKCAFLIFALVLLPKADQLACIDKEKAIEAKSVIENNTFLISYCSLCYDTVMIIVPRTVEVVEGCRFEVHLTGTITARSRDLIPRDSSQSVPVSYLRCNTPFSQNIDLAYVYCEVTPNRFQVLGHQIGLSASVATEWISLPRGLYKKLLKTAKRLKSRK